MTLDYPEYISINGLGYVTTVTDQARVSRTGVASGVVVTTREGYIQVTGIGVHGAP